MRRTYIYRVVCCALLTWACLMWSHISAGTRMKVSNFFLRQHEIRKRNFLSNQCRDDTKKLNFHDFFSSLVRWYNLLFFCRQFAFFVFRTWSYWDLHIWSIRTLSSSGYEYEGLFWQHREKKEEKNPRINLRQCEITLVHTKKNAQYYLFIWQIYCPDVSIDDGALYLMATVNGWTCRSENYEERKRRVRT